MLTVLGTTTVDIHARGIERMPERADDEFSNSSLVWLGSAVVPTLGGNGANAAYVAGALGERVRLWSAIGSDPFGELVLGWLRSKNVDTADLLQTTYGTSTTIILTDAAHRRNSFHHPGPAPHFMPHSASPGNAGDWLLLTSYTLLPNWRGPAAQVLFERARAAGVHIALDLGPILGSPPDRAELAPLLPLLDLLLCNSYELGEVSGYEREQAAAWALAAGVGAVVVKRGADGAAVYSASGPGGEAPCFTVPVVGTVGAGDSFDVGFIYAYSRGATLRESARFANAVAALVVSAPRGILDAPDLDKVQELLQHG